MPDQFYYLSEANQPVGPIDLAGIRQLIEAGVVKADVQVCPVGDETWQPLSEHEETPAPAPASPSTSAEAPKPPRTPPPPRVAGENAPASSSGGPLMPTHSTGAWPDWFPLASMITGIVAVLSMCLPGLSLVLAVPALTLGIIALRRPDQKDKPFAIAGISTASLGILCSLGILLLGLGGGGLAANSEAAAIEKALNDGRKVGLSAQKKYPRQSVSQARFIAAELQKVDTRACPPDFRVAYQRNIEAWEIAIPYFAADTPVNYFLEGFYGGLTNDYSAVGLSNYQAQMAAQNIDETYRDLRMIAVAYGARIPTL